MQTSTVKWFDAKKGYGFIHHPEDGDDVFVHYSQIESEDDFKTLRTGQTVQFELNDGPKGLHALSVVAMDDGEESRPSFDDEPEMRNGLETSTRRETEPNDPTRDEPVFEDLTVREDPLNEPVVDDDPLGGDALGGDLDDEFGAGELDEELDEEFDAEGFDEEEDWDDDPVF